MSREKIKARNRADFYFSKVIRSLGRCQRCERPMDPSELQAAHVIRRRYSRTRCVEGGAWALCGPCHATVDGDPQEFMFLVERTIGVDAYKRLYHQAHDNVSPLPDWPAEADFWRDLWKAVNA